MRYLLLVMLLAGCRTGPAKPSECIEFCKPWSAVGRYGMYNQECDCQPSTTPCEAK